MRWRLVVAAAATAVLVALPALMPVVSAGHAGPDDGYNYDPTAAFVAESDRSHGRHGRDQRQLAGVRRAASHAQGVRLPLSTRTHLRARGRMTEAAPSGDRRGGRS